MTLDGINEIRQNSFNNIKMSAGKRTEHFKPLLQFANKGNDYGTGDEPSEAELKTRKFINDIMSELDTSNSKQSPKNIKLLLDKLVATAQRLNGVIKMKLQPQGTPKQNENFKNYMQMEPYLMEDYAKSIGCNLSVVQDSKTGLYKLCIDNKLYDIPERKVELGISDTVNGEYYIPVIVD